MLLGEGVIAIWSGIAEVARDDFYAWHDTEHLPERVGIQGFLRGRRYRAPDALTEFLILYETASPETLSGAEYRHRLDHPTAWTRRMMPHFTGMERALTRVAFTRARADGGHVLAYGLSLAPDAVAPLRRALADGLLPELYHESRLLGVHLGLTDRDASLIPTEEQRMAPRGVPDGVVLVEASRPGDLAAPRARIDRTLAGLEGVTVRPAAGIWHLECQKLARLG